MMGCNKKEDIIEKILKLESDIKAISEANMHMLSKLPYSTRKNLPDSAFAIPSKRKYPIHDIAHARNALARVSAFGTPQEKAIVRRAVCRKYPEIESCKQK